VVVTLTGDDSTDAIGTNATDVRFENNFFSNFRDAVAEGGPKAPIPASLSALCGGEVPLERTFIPIVSMSAVRYCIAQLGWSAAFGYNRQQLADEHERKDIVEDRLKFVSQEKKDAHRYIKIFTIAALRVLFDLPPLPSGDPASTLVAEDGSSFDNALDAAASEAAASRSTAASSSASGSDGVAATAPRVFTPLQQAAIGVWLGTDAHGNQERPMLVINQDESACHANETRRYATVWRLPGVQLEKERTLPKGLGDGAMISCFICGFGLLSTQIIRTGTNFTYWGLPQMSAQMERVFDLVHEVFVGVKPCVFVDHSHQHHEADSDALNANKLSLGPCNSRSDANFISLRDTHWPLNEDGSLRPDSVVQSLTHADGRAFGLLDIVTSRLTECDTRGTPWASYCKADVQCIVWRFPDFIFEQSALQNVAERHNAIVKALPSHHCEFDACENLWCITKSKCDPFLNGRPQRLIQELAKALRAVPMATFANLYRRSELYLQCYGLGFDAYFTFLTAFVVTGRGAKGGKHVSHLKMGGAELGVGVKADNESGSDSDGSGSDTEAAVSSAAVSSSSAAARPTQLLPLTRVRHTPGARGVCIAYKYCKVTEGAPLCPSCQRACCLHHRGSLEAALARAFEEDGAGVVVSGYEATVDDYCQTCNEATAMQFHLTKKSAMETAPNESAPPALYQFPYGDLGLPLPPGLESGGAAGAASGSNAGDAASAPAAVAIVVPDALTEDDLQKCWGYFTRWGYPHLGIRRFAKVKERFHKIILEAATALASPTWPSGQSDLLATLLHKQPVPIWYAAGAPQLSKKHVTMKPSVAAASASAAAAAAKSVDEASFDSSVVVDLS